MGCTILLAPLFGAKTNTLNTLQKIVAQMRLDSLPKQSAQLVYVFTQASINFSHTGSSGRVDKQHAMQQRR